MDLGNFLHLFQGSNKKLVEDKIAEMESEAVDDPSKIGLASLPREIMPFDPQQFQQPVVAKGRGVPTDIATLGSLPTEALTPPIQNLVPANQYDPNVPNQIPVTPNPNAQGLLQRAQYPQPAVEAQPQPSVQPQTVVQPQTPVQPMTELERAQQEATAARNQKVEKQSKWKDVLAYIVQGANAAFNPAPGQKIVGYGQVKKDNAIREAERKLQTVQNETMKGAQIKDAQMRPELAIRESERKAREAENRALAAEQSTMIRAYNNLPDYDETRPDDRAFGDAFQEVMGYRPVSKNAKTKSVQVVDERDGQVYLLQTDEQGSETVKRLTNNDGSPFRIQTKAQRSSADREEQRKLQERIAKDRNITSVKVAEIASSGATQRTQMTIDASAQRQRADIDARLKLALQKAKAEPSDANKAEVESIYLEAERIKNGQP